MNSSETYSDVEPTKVDSMRRQQQIARVVDVREPTELTGELGHIHGVELVPLATIEDAAKSWAKDDAILLVCRSGKRSARAATMLAARGFRHVMNMAGGMLAWKEAQLPTER